MDRYLYQLPFSLDDVPHWLCPVCAAGRLTVDKKSLIAVETVESAKARDIDGWEPDWIRHTFSCVFRCDNGKCEAPISCCGGGFVDMIDVLDEEHGWVQEITDRFVPEYFYPALVLMDIPKKCPDAVISHLKESFALFFADPGASLNCARAALEAVLTGLGIKRFNVVKKKRRVIPLHQRITLLPAKYNHISELFLAVKWLGNAGSHDGDKVSKADVHMAYDLLEHALSEIYDEKTKKLTKVAKKVNKKKGPIQ